MARLDQKVAIVTGGARGSGAAIARRFAAEGAHVMVADLRDDLGAAVAHELGAAAAYTRADVSNEDDWAALVDATVTRFGRVDVLVNNAAVLLMQPLAQTSVEQYERVFRVNELGTFLGIRAVVPAMTSAGGGSIVNISSIDGVYVAPFTGAYAASKFAVRGLTKVAALELGAHGIRVNSVCPAAGNPDMVRESLPPALREAMDADPEAVRRTVPTPAVGRHGTTDDVAWAALYFASGESGYVTGTELVLDGGESAGMNIMARMSRR